ncbi:hypothetical protein BO71DRAFT_418598 [Aspergillus ellipticus CBS 707.79]|uniref:Uncharacterized protein n=1 Tax=Aspergillus ellipticus CBS 707.79 TaxID=1448320 RepID=A0A319DN17_9EURO|nr:hypothetical protein BO71DRAFT_418598 [Aspergillus ellipticus CBS 707.79]
MSLSMQSTTKPDLSSKRRRFQPPITNFFSASSSSSTPTSFNNNGDHATTTTTTTTSHLSYNHYSAATCSLTPIVPTKVQASLLSVGMRVRKSIADGYKTHLNGNSTTMFLTTEQPSKTISTTAGLAPFSGVNNSVIHPLPHISVSNNPHHNHTLITDEGDAYSLPPSSQESNVSQPPINSGHKRAYDLDLDSEDEYEYGGDMSESSLRIWQDPLGLNPPSHSASPIVGRTVLSPKLNQQRRQFVALQKQTTAGVSVMEVDDFEEPAFLRSREEVDMEYICGQGEVEMGGI